MTSNSAVNTKGARSHTTVLASLVMNCCATDIISVERSSEQLPERCGNCNGETRPVSRKTVLLMLKPELLEQAASGTYSFCEARDCPVIYFEEHSQRTFTQDDLRVVVGVKAIKDPIPLCYCFGFDESHIRDEISETGTTTVPKRISKLIREGLCACEARNPAGGCCLGDVKKAVKRLSEKKR